MKRAKVAVAMLAALLLLYLACTISLYAAMHQPPETFGAIMSKVPSVAMIVLPFEPLWMSARRGRLNPGDAAPDFLLPRLDKSGTVQLTAELRTRPVVLIFGSYT